MNRENRDVRIAPPQERQRRIVERIREAGTVSVAELEKELGISRMTVRRDLDALVQEGLVTRTHGGAVLPELAAHEDSFQQRLVRAVAAKERLASAAVDLIGSDATVFLDSSTTAYYLAQQLIRRGPAVTILTNCVPTMDLIAHAERPGLHLVGLGGLLRKLTGSFVGPLAVHAAAAHVADVTFLSVKGVTRSGQLTDPDPLEAEVKRVMIEQSRQSVLLIDDSKLGQPGMSVIANLSQLSTVLATDIPEQVLAALPAGDAEVRSV